MNDIDFVSALTAARSAGDRQEFNRILTTEGHFERLLPLAKAGAECRVHGITKSAPRAPRSTTGQQDEPEGFAVWYAEYPRHKARGAAARAYRAALKLTTAETLLAAVRRYKAECAGRDLDKVKHPATWLNGRCWEDEADLVSKAAGANVTQLVTVQKGVARLEMFYGYSEGIPAGKWLLEWGNATPNDRAACTIPAAAWDEFFRFHPEARAKLAK